jgi:hypothetical protein
VYGTVSMWQGKNAEEQKSFLWTAYVRGVVCVSTLILFLFQESLVMVSIIFETGP